MDGGTLSPGMIMVIVVAVLIGTCCFSRMVLLCCWLRGRWKARSKSRHIFLGLPPPEPPFVSEEGLVTWYAGHGPVRPGVAMRLLPLGADKAGAPIYLARCATPTGIWIGFVGTNPAVYAEGCQYAEPVLDGTAAAGGASGTAAAGAGSGAGQASAVDNIKLQLRKGRYYEVMGLPISTRGVYDLVPWQPGEAPPPGAIVVGRTAAGLPLLAGLWTGVDYTRQPPAPFSSVGIATLGACLCPVDGTACIMPGITVLCVRNRAAQASGVTQASDVKIEVPMAATTTHGDALVGAPGSAFTAASLAPVTFQSVSPAASGPNVGAPAAVPAPTGSIVITMTALAPTPAQTRTWGWGVGSSSQGVVRDPSGRWQTGDGRVLPKVPIPVYRTSHHNPIWINSDNHSHQNTSDTTITEWNDPYSAWIGADGGAGLGNDSGAGGGWGGPGWDSGDSGGGHHGGWGSDSGGGSWGGDTGGSSWGGSDSGGGGSDSGGGGGGGGDSGGGSWSGGSDS